MSLRKEFSQDTVKVTEGVPFEIGNNDDGSTVKLYLSRLSSSNPKYLKTVEAENRPYARQMRNNTLSTEKQKELTLRTFCKAILTGWENVLLSDVTGNPEDTGFAEFNFDNAFKLMSDLPDLYETAIGFSMDMSNFRADELEDATKN